MTNEGEEKRMPTKEVGIDESTPVVVGEPEKTEEKEKIDIIDSEGKVIGEMSVEEANEIVSDLLIDGIRFEKIYLLGVPFKLKTLTKGARAEIVKKVSEMEGSGMMVQDELVFLNLSNSLIEADGRPFETEKDAYDFLRSLEEHMFSKLYDKYLKFMFKVEAAINVPDAPKN